MTTNFLRKGETIDLTPTAAVSSGDVVPIGASGLIAVAITDIAAGATGAAKVSGVFQFAKEAGVAMSQGDQVLFDLAQQYVTNETSGNVAAGVVWADSASGDTTVDVYININR